MEQRFLETVDGGQFLPAVQEKEPSLMQIIANAAVNPAVDVDKLERLIALQERALNREAEQAFIADFTKIQAELPQIEHDKNISHSKDGSTKKISSYATFETINDIVKPLLTKYNFSISFDIVQNDNKVKTACTLSHAGGFSKTTNLELPIDSGGAKSATQAVISSVSYGKRQTLCAILNIVTKGEADIVTQNEKRISPYQAMTIQALLNKLSQERQIDFASKVGLPENISRGQFQNIVNRLKNEAGV